MNRAIASVCVILLILTLVAGCSSNDSHNVISCADVISAYEEAGYEVWHNEYTDEDFLCTVNAENADGDSIYFTFFDSADEAEQYVAETQWNVILWIYSMVNGDPIWVYTEAYDTIAIQYENADLYAPFQELK